MKKLLLIGSLLSLAVAAIAAPTATKEVILGQPDLQWQQPFGPQGPSFGFVAGKFGDKNPASMFVKVNAGFDSGWHTHDEEYTAIVVKGTFTEQQAGDAAEKPLATGTYFTQPAKVVHRNGCLAGSDCLVFVHFDKGAQSTPTTRDGKPVTPAKK